MITGQQLRDARKHAHLSQQALAETLGVSLRTIGNWERGQFIHPNNWHTIRKTFPGINETDTPIVTDANDPDVAWIATEIAKTQSRAIKQAKQLSVEHSSTLHAQMAENIDTIFDFALNAAELGADPELVNQLAITAFNTLLDTGTLNIITKAADPGYVQRIMNRIITIQNAAASYTYKSNDNTLRIANITNINQTNTASGLSTEEG
jgi:DNA-binding XRE family transcriptional regulator